MKVPDGTEAPLSVQAGSTHTQKHLRAPPQADRRIRLLLRSPVSPAAQRKDRSRRSEDGDEIPLVIPANSSCHHGPLPLSGMQL